MTDCIVFDREAPCGGPLRGVLSALELVRDDILYVTVDHPYLKADTLKRLLHHVVLIPQASSSTIISGPGETAQSIGYVSRELVERVGKICSAKRGKARLIDIYRLPGSVLVGWSLLTMDPGEFTNVNRPGVGAKRAGLRVDEVVFLNHDYFADYINHLLEVDLLGALKSLYLEASLYSKLGLRYLIKYVYRDIDALVNPIP